MSPRGVSRWLSDAPSPRSPSPPRRSACGRAHCDRDGTTASACRAAASAGTGSSRCTPASVWTAPPATWRRIEEVEMKQIKRSAAWECRWSAHLGLHAASVIGHQVDAHKRVQRVEAHAQRADESLRLQHVHCQLQLLLSAGAAQSGGERKAKKKRERDRERIIQSVSSADNTD